ncbi:MAG: hypothetical protein OQK82_05325 [Candidatus Pacearchaeota archaeon]|nr:hypothetical protein [Candidatus Pacearchaeota archaeon]
MIYSGRVRKNTLLQDDEYFYNDYVMLYGSLHIYSARYNDAVQILSTVKVNNRNDYDKQILYYIHGIAFLKLGKHPEAIENF